jgi:quercetin dioxygenase-like cupin family protein
MGDRLMVDGWTWGNANDDASATRGWLVGHFLPPTAGVRADDAVEVKWFNHPAGDTRKEWTADDQRTTLVLLVGGEFRIDLTAGTSTLRQSGDYVMWGPGIDHSWTALADSTILTVRWRSAPVTSGS